MSKSVRSGSVLHTQWLSHSRGSPFLSELLASPGKITYFHSWAPSCFIKSCWSYESTFVVQHRAADRSFCDDIAHPWTSSSHLSGAADRLDESFLGQDRLPHLPFVLYCLGFTLQLLGLQLFLEKAEFVGDLNLYSMLDWDSTNHTDWNIFSW